jgi:CheY-like chemotaxis protein
MYQFNKVLLVDDDAATNFLAELAIKNLDIAKEIEVASDGQAAWEMIKQTACPDIIFLDIRMPRMDGFDFLECFSAMNCCKNVKIVVLTSSSRLEDKDKAFTYKGVIAYYEKPLTEEMVQKVAAMYF